MCQYAQQVCVIKKLGLSCAKLKQAYASHELATSCFGCKFYFDCYLFLVIEHGYFNNKIKKLRIFIWALLLQNFFMNFHSFFKTWNNEEVMNKSWTSPVPVLKKKCPDVKKSWPSYEQILIRLWPRYEQVMKKLWASCAQDIDKSWKKNKPFMNKLWISHE